MNDNLEEALLSSLLSAANTEFAMTKAWPHVGARALMATVVHPVCSPMLQTSVWADTLLSLITILKSTLAFYC